MNKSFRKGQVVLSGENAVLVTGKGDKKQGYPTFAGVVVMAIERDDEDRVWPVGMYSDTWSTEAFKKVDIKLSKLVAGNLKPKPPMKGEGA